MKNNIGILGFGVVGKSALKFLKQNYKNFNIDLWDKRSLSSFESDLLKEYGIQNPTPLTLNEFLKKNKKIFLSPGFSPKSLPNICINKILCELDFFAKHYKEPVVAITGSLGKTTITSYLNNLVQKFNLKSIAGGNIGYPLLDLIRQKVDMAFLELSSFQLKFNKRFSPQIAIFNNFYPNHLDWHKDLKDYFDSKCKIFEFQKKNQFSIFPIGFLDNDLSKDIQGIFLGKLKNLKSKICFVGKNFKKDIELIKNNKFKNVFLFSKNKQGFIFYNIVNNKIINKKQLLDLNFLPKISYQENWFFIIATLFLLNIKPEKNSFESVISNFSLDDYKEHRLELFLNYNDIDFYNDSKSTVFQATIKAIDKLEKNNRPIILILGGLNKGVDRTPLIEYLNKVKNLKKILCLGSDCKTFCPYKSYSSLKDIIDVIFKFAEQGDQVLFSPSGSSFDLFKNYQHRGDVFKKLILEKISKK
ncbi:UDP-N-acetylmuramoyl-L-alanine--D-glutamate ligase [Candidatus Dependentiae bacterium]|nr:UDP-N-acetylmuramoyl-L-alanine--D-glutamate ligase [Candidatus Dependentiae bacterium]